MMLILIIILIIIPFILGLFIKHLLHSNIFQSTAFWFALGFLVMVGEFALVCYPAIFIGTSFHLVCYVVFGIYMTECLAIILWFFTTKQFQNKEYISKKDLGNWLRSPAFWMMIAICLFQILRLLIAGPFEMRDSKSYNALIIDILQSDQLFMRNPENGFPVHSFLDMPLKFSLSPWYAYISMVAKLSHIHPLIISNTVLPAYLLLVHYIIIFSLGLYLFAQNKKHTCLFTALFAFIQEISLFCHTPTMIKLVWPVWGKGALSMTVIPAILVLFILYVNKDSRYRSVYFIIVLLLLAFAGCSMSTMGAIELPLEIGLLGLIWTIRKRSICTLLYSIISCIPAILYLICYYYLSTLQNLG